MRLVDSDVLVEIQKGTPESKVWLANLDGRVALPVAVTWEMLIGSRNKQELARSQKFLSTFPIVQLDPRDSDKVSELISKHGLSSGANLGDFMIAAQALCRNVTLYSFNLKHYQPITGLDVRSPYARYGL